MNYGMQTKHCSCGFKYFRYRGQACAVVDACYNVQFCLSNCWCLLLGNIMFSLCLLGQSGFTETRQEDGWATGCTADWDQATADQQGELLRGQHSDELLKATVTQLCTWTSIWKYKYKLNGYVVLKVNEHPIWPHQANTYANTLVMHTLQFCSSKWIIHICSTVEGENKRKERASQ